MENENISFTELVEATEIEQEKSFDLNKILEIIDKVSGIVERLSKKKEENQQINKVSTIIHKTETEPQQPQQEQNINIQELVNEYIKNNNIEITKSILLNNFDLFFNKIKEILKEQSEKNGEMTLKQLNNLLNTFENIAKTKGKEYIKNIEVL